ncbi:(2Fe-2S)-binding protein [Gammaproteobacteria bacterium]|nr:(2Fe-2S)-binding protein [Gammaproteobacteria bacterium]
MFKVLGDAGEQLLIELDGAEVMVPADVSVAAALLYLDRIPTRHSVVKGLPRAPFCMMGICFECLIEVDGVVDQRACQIQVQAGMRLRLQLRTAAASG